VERTKIGDDFCEVKRHCVLRRPRNLRNAPAPLNQELPAAPST
jgi:hypothetical protein